MVLNNSQVIIALEGIDGAGKSTLIKSLYQEFKDISKVYSRTKKGKLLDYVVSRKIVQHNYGLQIIIYLFLSLKNYLYFYKYRHSQLVLMDRCFLSNFCYFYPDALCNIISFKKHMRFEVKLIPQKIYIIDADPRIAYYRDNKKKNMDWLISTRKNYLKSAEMPILKYYDLEIIDSSLTVEEKQLIISSYIRHRIGH